MKKNSLGLTIGTVLTVIVCIIAAVLFWLFVKYSELDSALALKTVFAALPFVY